MALKHGTNGPCATGVRDSTALDAQKTKHSCKAVSKRAKRHPAAYAASVLAGAALPCFKPITDVD